MATSTTETEVHQLDLEHSEKSKILYGILCQCCENRALSLLKLAARSCGLEGWRLLLLEYEPRASVRIAQRLSGILQPKFSNSLNQFQLELTQWKIQVSKYEGIASGEGGKHILDDTVKIATVLGHAPPVIRQFLATRPQDFAKFEDLERSLIGFIGAAVAVVAVVAAFAFSFSFAVVVAVATFSFVLIVPIVELSFSFVSEFSETFS